MANANVEIFSDFSPKIFNVNDLCAVLLKIKDNFEIEEKIYPKEVRLKLSLDEWTSLIRDTKYDEGVILCFLNDEIANISFVDYNFPFIIGIAY